MKTIKVNKSADKQVGVRLEIDLYDKIVELSRKHDTSVQEVIRYMLREEIDNYN